MDKTHLGDRVYNLGRLVISYSFGVIVIISLGLIFLAAEHPTSFKHVAESQLLMAIVTNVFSIPLAIVLTGIFVNFLGREEKDV